MRKSLALSIALVISVAWSSHARADDDAQDAKKKLTAEQQQLLDAYAELLAREQARHFNPQDKVPLQPLPQIRKDLADRVSGMTKDEAKVFWRDLPYDLKRRFRRLEVTHVLADERKAAERLPVAAKTEVARLLSDSLDDFLAARRKVLTYGPACRALVADQLAGLPMDSPKRLRHLGVLDDLDRQETRERVIRVTEAASQRLAELARDRKKATSSYALLVSRRLCDQNGWRDPYKMCYYNFIHRNHDYKAGVALEFGNGEGNRLGFNFYGGQDNRIDYLGAADFEDIKKAPGPDTTEKWSRGNDGQPIPAMVGHVYLLHLVDPGDMVDLTVKFRVLDRSSEEWIVIEWEAIPQEK
jgi:hypothetical protein